MLFCGAVVKELLARAAEPGSTPSDADFCVLVPFFSVYSLFSNPIFLLACHPLVLLLTLHADHVLGINIHFIFLAGKEISRALDMHTGQTYGQKITISCQDMSLL